METLFSIDLTNRGGEYLAPTVLASFPASTVFSQAAGSSAHTGSISTSGGGNLWWLAPLGVGGGLYEGTR